MVAGNWKDRSDRKAVHRPFGRRALPVDGPNGFPHLPMEDHTFSWLEGCLETIFFQGKCLLGQQVG